jgi:UDP-N-acetylglucosamine diphosphorylase/glucosamine-1-phosphate N-acetyltransferase
MKPELCIYEDEKACNFHPLTLTRPVHELLCGMFSLSRKLIRHFPGHRVRYFVRREMVDVLSDTREEIVVNPRPENGAIFINSRFILQNKLPESFESSVAFVANGVNVGGFLLTTDLKRLRFDKNDLLMNDSFSGLPEFQVQGLLLEYPWDLVHNNAGQIRADFDFAGRGGQILGKQYANVTLIARENIHVGLGSTLYPGVVIDGESGPVYISEEATVMANAVIEGPAFIGKDSKIKIGAKIYGGTTIGDICKVGGEVEGSILHGYANKQHDGFLGHAYLGEWVNLGADTNNSDLKNNYRSVRVPINGEMVDSGSPFVGLFMGDHSKSGINTMFNTGTVVGVSCNVFGSGFPKKDLPSFTWGGVDAEEKYDLEKAIETARIVMSRRKKQLTPAQEALLRRIYEREK